jgi:hypothetical protein
MKTEQAPFGAGSQWGSPTQRRQIVRQVFLAREEVSPQSKDVAPCQQWQGAFSLFPVPPTALPLRTYTTMPTINLVYGAYDLVVEDFHLTVSEWAAAFRDVLSLGDDAVPFLNGQRAKWNDGVEAGDRVEFMKLSGKKGCDVLSKREFCLRYHVAIEEWERCLKAGLRVGTHEGVVVVIPEQGVEVLQQVRATLNASLSSAKTSVAGLHIDESAFSIHFDGKTCRLGNTKQYTLFRVLARNAGAPVSHDSLFRLVWEDFTPETNTLHKLASRLQESLDDAGMSALVIDGRSVRRHYTLTVRR